MNKNTGKMLVASKLQESERERVHLYINGHGRDYKIYRRAKRYRTKLKVVQLNERLFYN